MKIRLLAAVLLLSLAAHAQQIQISAVVQDAAGCTYAGGSGSAVLQPPNQNWLINGTNPVPAIVPIAAMDSFGRFSLTLTNTSLITPSSANPEWQFNLCSSTSVSQPPICFSTTPIPLISSQDLSTIIDSQAAPLNCNHGGGGGGGGPGTGTTNDITFWQTPTTLGSFGNNVSGQQAVTVYNAPPIAASPSVTDSSLSPSTSPYTIQCDTTTTIIDRAHTFRLQAGSSPVTIPLSSASGCFGMIIELMNDSTGTITFNTTSPDVVSVFNGGTPVDNATTFTLPVGQFVSLNQDAAGQWEARISGGGGLTVVASGTATMGTAAIASGTCAAPVTVSAASVVTTNVISAAPNTDPTIVTGYIPSVGGSLYIELYPTAGNVNFKVCNNTSGSITPAALTLNWVALGPGSGGGGGGGPLGPCTQYDLAWWSTTTSLGCVGNNISGQFSIFQNNSAPIAVSPGIIDASTSPVSTSPYLLRCDSTTTLLDRLTSIRLQSGASVVTIPLSSASGCGGMTVTVLDDGGGTVTFNRTSPDTLSVFNGSTNTDGASSFTLTNGQYVTLNQAASGIWEARITTGGSGGPGTGAADFLPLWIGSPEGSTSTTLGNSHLADYSGSLVAEETLRWQSPIGTAYPFAQLINANSFPTSGCNTGSTAYATFGDGTGGPTCYSIWGNMNAVVFNGGIQAGVYGATGVTANGTAAPALVAGTFGYSAFDNSGSQTAPWVAGAVGFAQNEAAGGTQVTNLAGVVGIAQEENGSDSGNMMGVYGQTQSISAGFSGTLSFAAALYGDSPRLNSGFSIVNAYGLYVADQATGAAGGTVANPFGIFQAGAADKNVFQGTLTVPAVIPGILYSAAGTPLPTCGAGINGELAVVSDATAPTYMGAYTSGGAITAAVICSYNGSVYAWKTH
jgi:hypothetical protein